MNSGNTFHQLPHSTRILALAVSLFLLLFSTEQLLGQAISEEFVPLDSGSLMETLDNTQGQVDGDGFVSLDGGSLMETLDDSEFTETLEVKKESPSVSRYLIWVYYLSFTILAALLVRFRKLRYTRHFLLLVSLVYFGFFTGGCPCVISAFQNVILALAGVDVRWESLVFFAAIMLFTYLFGRVWCGWACHLGALQEFLYSSHIRKIPFLKSEKIQKVLRTTRIILFVVLIAQLIITKENLFVHIDPFKVAFNLSSYYVTGWILLAILLVSSLFIYRPFCQAVCPISLVMGWVSKIPGAFRLSTGFQCNGCSKCSKTCLSNAIHKDPLTRHYSVDNRDCIVCGSCLDECRNHSICLDRKPLHEKPAEVPAGLKN